MFFLESIDLLLVVFPHGFHHLFVHHLDFVDFFLLDLFELLFDGIGLMLLCQVAVGKSRSLIHSDYNAADLPSGCSSTYGVGRTIPDPKGDIDYDGCTLATGKPVANPAQASLLYNEFIVYDVD